MILVIVEHLQGKLNKMSLEALSAAASIGKEMNHPVEALLIGSGVAAMSSEIPAAKLHVVEHPLLEKYTADGYSAALKQVIAKLNPWLVLLPHTYQVRDFAPKLAAGLGRSFVSDGTGYKVENGELQIVRQLFAGKVACDVAFGGASPFFASVQAGAFRGAEAAAAATIEKIEVTLDASQIRNVPEDWFQEAKRSEEHTSELQSRRE